MSGQGRGRIGERHGRDTLGGRRRDTEGRNMVGVRQGNDKQGKCKLGTGEEQGRTGLVAGTVQGQGRGMLCPDGG